MCNSSSDFDGVITKLNSLYFKRLYAIVIIISIVHFGYSRILFERCLHRVSPGKRYTREMKV